MKVLLDENLPYQLRTNLLNHDVSTAQYLGWNGMKNGELLRAAESSGFECLVTCDQNLSYQQNLQSRSIAVVTLTRQKWKILKFISKKYRRRWIKQSRGPSRLSIVESSGRPGVETNVVNS